LFEQAKMAMTKSSDGGGGVSLAGRK